MVFSDFRHGIFNRRTIPTLTDAIPDGHVQGGRQPGGEPLGQHHSNSSGFDLITPNEREARFALGDQDSGVRPLGARALSTQAECKTLILKLGDAAC